MEWIFNIFFDDVAKGATIITDYDTKDTKTNKLQINPNNKIENFLSSSNAEFFTSTITMKAISTILLKRVRDICR